MFKKESKIFFFLIVIWAVESAKLDKDQFSCYLGHYNYFINETQSKNLKINESQNACFPAYIHYSSFIGPKIYRISSIIHSMNTQLISTDMQPCYCFFFV